MCLPTLIIIKLNLHLSSSSDIWTFENYCEVSHSIKKPYVFTPPPTNKNSMSIFVLYLHFVWWDVSSCWLSEVNIEKINIIGRFVFPESIQFISRDIIIDLMHMTSRHWKNGRSPPIGGSNRITSKSSCDSQNVQVAHVPVTQAPTSTRQTNNKSSFDDVNAQGLLLLTPSKNVVLLIVEAKWSFAFYLYVQR